MTTAIIGTGRLGGTLARLLVNGGERVILAASSEAQAAALAQELGELASAGSVRKAITDADVAVLATYFPIAKDTLTSNADLLDGVVVIDPTNANQRDETGKTVTDETGRPVGILPEGQSAGAVIAGLLPPGAHYVKAFGTLGVPSLASSANRAPERAALLYATDDEHAAAVAERLITAAGFDPVKAGSAADAGRLELPRGDLHQYGSVFNGQVPSAAEARAASAGTSR
jgi:8-hydroxy-5-deazaflavin:NADPH oxidoreductase